MSMTDEKPEKPMDIIESSEVFIREMSFLEQMFRTTLYQETQNGRTDIQTSIQKDK